MPILTSLLERVKSILSPRGKGPDFLSGVMPWVVIGGDHKDVCLAIQVSGDGGPLENVRFVYDSEDRYVADGASPLSLLFDHPGGRTVRARLGSIDPAALLRILETPSVAVLEFDGAMECHIHQAPVFADEDIVLPVPPTVDRGDPATPYDVTVIDILDEGVDSGAWEALVRINGFVPFDRKDVHDCACVRLAPAPPYDIGIRFTVLGTLLEAEDGTGQVSGALLTGDGRLEALSTDLNLEVAVSDSGDPSLAQMAVAEITARYAARHGLDPEPLVPTVRGFGAPLDLDEVMRSTLSRRHWEYPANAEVDALISKLHATFG